MKEGAFFSLVFCNNNAVFLLLSTGKKEEYSTDCFAIFKPALSALDCGPIRKQRNICPVLSPYDGNHSIMSFMHLCFD